MANTRQIKRRITAAQNISKITKAMEMVAASKMKRAQDQATAARPYSRALQDSLHKLTQNINPELHPLLSINTQGTPLLVVISTDKGLCGSLNAQLFKETLHWFRQNRDGSLVAIGRKAVQFAHIAGLPLHAQFTDLPEKITTPDILAISELMMSGYKRKKFSTVSLIYMDFINTLSQEVRTVTMLPVGQTSYKDETLSTLQLAKEYTFEPSAHDILQELIPYYVENTLFQAFLEARASEHSARMVTMKNASENASDLVSELKLEFNKNRQASITNELLDITTASLTIS